MAGFADVVTKKDYFLVSIIGILFGLFSLPILKNIKLFSEGVSAGKAILIILGFFIFANFALWVASILARWIPVLLQIAKFLAIGALNTFLDLGVLNILILFTGVAVGSQYSLFKGISFAVATVNSYFWNKYWTFGSQNSANAKEFAQFFAVSIIGLGFNLGAASLVVNFFGAPAGISPELWANIGAVSATLVSLVWNFIGYKVVVFKKNEKTY